MCSVSLNIMYEEDSMDIRTVPAEHHKNGIFISLDLDKSCTVLLTTTQAELLANLILNTLEEIKLDQSNGII